MSGPSSKPVCKHPGSRTVSPFPDAGLRGLGHYERRLPKWRFWLRQRLIPIVRWETPYLARMQEFCRTPWLDAYFAFTANLGTHTFFMTALPICFWCGYPDAGLALVHILAMGVYASGFIKDLACLPRPLSPPLQRITQSGLAALEYGFPSTHTTNAVSVAIYCLSQLYAGREQYSTPVYVSAWLGLLCYATSITFGRMYCGMHGFFDVVSGLVLGAVIAWVRISFGAEFDTWILAGNWERLAIVVAILAVLVRVHPEPADNCPCFDDSVSFVGVVMGIEIGLWQHARHHSTTWSSAPLFTSIYPPAGWDPLKITARLVGGILIIFCWRAVMKPTLLRALPPVFRFISLYGLTIPRRYFLQARDYRSVPPLRKDDNVIPPASEIPAMVSKLGHVRKRRVSVGPQSEADAREYIATRDERRHKRRSSRNLNGAPKEKASRSTPTRTASEEEAAKMDALAASKLPDSPMSTTNSPPSMYHGRPLLQVDPTDPNLLTPPLSDAGASSDSGKEDERKDREMFSALEKPRIRYDVEVITKLVVYAGIAWWAVEGNPTWFEWVGI